MKIVKVDATSSTNVLAKAMNVGKDLENFCLSAEFQTNGRGQQSNTWQSQKSKNLTFTLVFNKLQLHIQHRFLLSALVCVEIYHVLKLYNIHDVALKWPNDILADQQKICGILIENTLSGNFINTSYVGIGLNVNQVNFEGLHRAISLKTLLQKDIDRNVCLQRLADRLKTIPEKIAEFAPKNILNDYKSKLYRFELDSKFLLKNRMMTGKIKDVASDGRLFVEFSDGTTEAFQHKEIQQVF